MSNCCCCCCCVEIPKEVFVRPTSDDCAEYVHVQPCNPEIVTIATPALDWVEKETETVEFTKLVHEEVPVKMYSADWVTDVQARTANVNTKDTRGHTLQVTGKISGLSESIALPNSVLKQDTPTDYPFSDKEIKTGAEVGADANTQGNA